MASINREMVLLASHRLVWKRCSFTQGDKHKNSQIVERDFPPEIQIPGPCSSGLPPASRLPRGSLETNSGSLSRFLWEKAQWNLATLSRGCTLKCSKTAFFLRQTFPEFYQTNRFSLSNPKKGPANQWSLKSQSNLLFTCSRYHVPARDFSAFYRDTQRHPCVFPLMRVHWCFRLPDSFLTLAKVFAIPLLFTAVIRVARQAHHRLYK